jgi:bifunctional enzyme CysN/CysC
MAKPQSSAEIAAALSPQVGFPNEGSKGVLRFLTCGSVDDGKSTLIGRLLYDSQLVFEDQFAALENDSQKLGTTGETADRDLCPVDA